MSNPLSENSDTGPSQRAVEAVMDVIAEKFGACSGDTAWACIDAYITARGFRDLERDIIGSLNEHYPTDIFPGPYRPDADPGVRFVVKLREALAELPPVTQVEIDTP